MGKNMEKVNTHFLDGKSDDEVKLIINNLAGQKYQKIHASKE